MRFSSSLSSFLTLIIVVIACLLAVAPTTVQAKYGQCAPFNGGYTANISCNSEEGEGIIKCLYKDDNAAVTIQEMDFPASATGDDDDDDDDLCCMQVIIDYTDLPFPVIFTNLCREVTTTPSGNIKAECGPHFEIFGTTIGSGTDYYRLNDQGNNLIVTPKTGSTNDPNNNAALGKINGNRIKP